MKKLFLVVCFLFIATSCFAKDVKIYDSKYRYVGKIDSATGNIYDNKWRRVGKIDTTTGKMYDKNYRRTGTIRLSK